MKCLQFAARTYSETKKQQRPENKQREECPQNQTSANFLETLLAQSFKIDSLSHNFYKQVNPLREPLELDSKHFTPFELSLLEMAVPVNRLSNREHSPTSSFNIKQDHPDTEFAKTATSLELYLHSQSYTPPLPTVSLSTLQAYPEA
jgi:hypothetical protein